MSEGHGKPETPVALCPQKVSQPQSLLESVSHSATSRPPFAKWVARGGFPPLPCTAVQYGPILLVSLFDGISSAAMTLAALGLQFCFVAVEPSPLLEEVSSTFFSNRFHFPFVNSFHFCDLPDVWKHAPFWLILIIAGSVQGPALSVSREVQRLAEEVKSFCKAQEHPAKVVALFETTNNAQVSQRSLQGPLLLDAADFGHLSRKQAWWFWSDPAVSCQLDCLRLPDIAIDCDAVVAGKVAIHFKGKPSPKRIFFADGFVKQGQAPFSISMPKSCSVLSLFSESMSGLSFLRKDAKFRFPNPHEVAQMQGIPVAALPDNMSLDWCNAALGSFHIPSLSLVCKIVGPPSTASMPRPWYEPQEARLRALVKGSVFEPGFCVSFPGTLTARQLASQALHRCEVEGVRFSRSGNDLVVALSQVPLGLLQVFWVHTQLLQLPGDVQGPEWAQQKASAATSLAFGLQKGAVLSRFALPPLHPPGLTKEEHIAASAQVPSPFDSPVPVDTDLAFACTCMAVFGPYVKQWRSQQIKAVRKLAKVLAPWEVECVSQMPECVHKVAAAKKPMFMLLSSLSLRWPDETNALRYISGFSIVGDIESSALFRPLQVDHTLPTGLDVLLGSSAVSNLVGMRRRVQPGPHDADLWQMTKQEIEDGFADGPFTEDDLNKQFGVGGWRPLERFVHVQSCGKLRCIDSGKRPGHNLASRESETIYTTSVDIVPAIVRYTFQLACHYWGSVSQMSAPRWCEFVLGTEDMRQAYRQCPVLPLHRCCSVVAFWHAESDDVRFVILNGLPFGLSSAVLSFNRTPALLTALARRFCGCAAAHFFDDSGIVDFAVGHGHSQALLREVYTLAGALLDTAKSQPPADTRVFLGLQVNVALAAAAGIVEIDLKPGFREAVRTDIGAILEARTLTSGQAAKLRGKFGWAASGTYGKCARGGQAPLVSRQYFDSTDALTDALRDCLLFHSLLAQFVGPRQVHILGSQLPPVRIYSDASYEPDTDVVAGIGFVVFDAASKSAPVGMAGALSPDILQLFEQRHQQITPCETLLSVIVPHNLSYSMIGRDVIWYVDNQAAIF